MANLVYSKIDLLESLLSIKENETLVITNDMYPFKGITTRVSRLRSEGKLGDRRILLVRDIQNETAYAIRFASIH